MPLTVTSATRQLSDGNPVGTVLGQNSEDSIAFYGATPTPQILQGSLAGANGILSVYTISASPAAVPGNSTSEVSITVTGVASTDMVVAVNKPTAQAGLVLGASRVSATNTARITIANVTAGTLTPTTTESYIFIVASAALQFPAVTLTPASVAATSAVEQFFTVNGVEPGLVMACSKPTHQAGLLVAGCRASASNQVAVTFMNVTTGVLTPTAAESWLFFGARGLRIQPVMQRMQVSLTPASVAANTSAEQTFTVTGLIASTQVQVDPPSTAAGCVMGMGRVSAANTLALTWANVTASAVTPPAGIYTIGFYPQAAPAAAATNASLTTQGVEGGLSQLVLGLTGGPHDALPTNVNVVTG